jgi:hypothetical protein
MTEDTANGGCRIHRICLPKSIQSLFLTMGAGYETPRPVYYFRASSFPMNMLCFGQNNSFLIMPLYKNNKVAFPN